MGTRVIIALLCCTVIVGCSKQCRQTGDVDPVLVRIGGYKLYDSEFEAEAALILGNKPRNGDLAAARRELLEQMITRKVLLQTAVNRGLDKNAAFTKEIERYWEQALLKMLLTEKSDELALDPRITDKEAAMRQWIQDVRDAASITVDERVWGREEEGV